MFPSASVQNSAYRIYAHVVNIGNISVKEAFAPEGKNLWNVVLGQLRAWVQSSVSFFGAPFLDHVLHIVHLGTKEKVFWVHARRIVARVQNEQTIWYGAVYKFPCNAVSGRRGLFVKCKFAVAKRVATPQPWPATIVPRRSVNAAPEPSQRAAKLWRQWFVVPIQSPVVHIAKAPGNPIACTLVCRTSLADSTWGRYFFTSHDEVPSRCDQRHRSVASGRCLAFIAENRIIWQRHFGGRVEL